MEPMRPDLKKKILDDAAKAFSGKKTREELDRELEEYQRLLSRRLVDEKMPEGDLKRLADLYTQFEPFIK